MNKYTFEITSGINGKLAKDIEKVIAIDVDDADYASCNDLIEKIEKHVKK